VSSASIEDPVICSGNVANHSAIFTGPTPVRLSAKGGSIRNPGVAGAIAEWHTERMSTKLIEQHLTDLQRRVASLEAAVKPRPRDAWKQIIGISKGQPLDREAARLGAEWRAKENKRK